MSRFAKAVLSAALLSGVVCTTSLIFADDTAAPATPAPVKTDSNAAVSESHMSGKHALDRPMPELKFNATPLSDVIDFLADTTNANFSVDWKALDAAHVAKDAPVTLRLSGKVPLHKVLDLILKQAAGDAVLTYHVDSGVIEITTQEADDKVMISRVYPIQDLLFQPTDFTNAPDLSLQNASQGQSAGGGGGGSGGGGQGGGQSLFSGNGNTGSGQQNQAASQKDRADEIIKLITDTVKPELWQANGGTATIQFFRGNLIVNAPRAIHELLESH
jgi:general secretion pathway protein D